MPRHLYFVPAGVPVWGYSADMRFVRDAVLTFDLDTIEQHLERTLASAVSMTPRLRFADERLWMLVKLLADVVDDRDPSTQLYGDGLTAAIIGQWVKDIGVANGRFDVELVDLADFNLPLLDEAAHPAAQEYAHEHTKRWSRSVASADAYVFVTPEYCYFPPASLINAVQVVTREWAHKPAGVVSYGGVSGGLRASQCLRQLVTSVNVHPLPQVVPIASFRQFIGDDGLFRAKQPMVDGTSSMLDELHKWAAALKTMRTNQAA